MLIVHLFVSYAHINLCHFFSSSWCRGLAVASACGSSWTFLLTFLPGYIILKAGEPPHEIMALFILCKLILQTHMCSNSVGLDV